MISKYLIIIKLFSFALICKSINIDDFGAKSNDTSYETAILNGLAFNKALNAANSSMSDRSVLIQSNKVYTMLPAGFVYNIINVTILLEGKLNAFNGDINKWPKDQNGHSYSFILIKYTQGLVIKGNGSINGHGFAWWLNVVLTGEDNRPNLLDISSGKDTLIQGISVYNSPQYHLFLMDQLDLIVENVLIRVDVFDDKILAMFPLNTDGIDISGRNIHLKNLTIQNFDDAVAVKALKRFESNFTNCTENILVENSSIKYGVGMSIGSVTPDLNVNCIRNVTFRNISFIDPLKAIYIKTNPGDNGYAIISQITYENIEIYNALWWAIFIGPQQMKQPHKQGKSCSFLFPLNGTECTANPRVSVSDVTLKNINIHNGLLSTGILICNSTNPCTGFIFENVNVFNRSLFPIQQGYLCENIQGTAVNSNIYPNCLN